MKRVGLDSLPLLSNFPQGGGISKYITPLFRHLISVDKSNAYFLFNRLFRKKSRQGLSHIDNFGFPNLYLRNIYLPDRLLGSSLAEYFLYRGVDVFISTCYFTPRLKKTKVISFIYDLIPLMTPTFDHKYRRIFSNLIKTTIQRSSLLLTISENSKKDLVDYFNLNPDQIKVIYPAAESYFKPLNREEILPVLQKYGIDSEYILFVGIRGKHKNILGLINAFSKLKTKRRISHKLVLCGRRDSSNGEVESQIKDIMKANRLEKSVIFTGYVDDQELPAIYSGARIFVFPSFYEGFGMPVLEALSCGLPCVVSERSSLPEIVNAAALTVNPDSQEELEEAIYKLISDENLRKDLEDKAIIQSQKFSWEKSAEKIRGIINS